MKSFAKSKIRLKSRRGSSSPRARGGSLSISKIKKNATVPKRYEAQADIGFITKSEAEQLFQKVFRNSKNAHPQPVAILTAGVSGAGKSSTLASCLNELQMKLDQFIVHDPDFLFTESLCYRQASDVMDREKCQPGAGDLNKQFMSYSMQAGLNFILDGTGKNNKYYTSLIRILRSMNYRVIMIATHIELETALARVQSRFKTTGRLVPENVVRNIYAGFLQSLPIYAKNQDLNGMYIYDNNGAYARLMWKRNIDGTSCCSVSSQKFNFELPCSRNC
jgi:predicted ABC-type ATPase